MEEIYANVDLVKPVRPRRPTDQTSRGGSDRRFLGAVVLFLGLLSFFLLAALIGLGVHLRDSAAEHSAVRDDLTERLQAAENKTSSQSEEIERLRTWTKQIATCPAGWRRFDSTCYFVSAEKDSWENGWNDCKRRGAELAIIDGAEEQKFLSVITNQDTWIGLTDRDQEGTWTWSDGTPLTLPFWRAGQPDDGGGVVKHGQEDCATIDADEAPSNNWNDLRCDASRPWICEQILKVI